MNEFYWDNEDNFLFVARGLFKPEDITDLNRYIKKSLSEYEPKNERDRELLDYGVAPDEIRLNEKIFDVWKRADLSILPKELEAYKYIIYPPMIRNVKKGFDFVPWHQDVSYIRNIKHKKHNNAIICFTPLDENPSEKSTLEFCFKKGEVELEPVFRKEHKVNVFDLKDEDTPKESECISFELNRGDVLMFGMLTLHRTFIKDETMLDRLSTEFRITREDNILKDRDYFNIESSKMTKGSN